MAGVSWLRKLRQVLACGPTASNASPLCTRPPGPCRRFIPMSLLFFLMAFVNTIIDSLKDSLVITAAGGGTEVRSSLRSRLPSGSVDVLMD